MASRILLVNKFYYPRGGDCIVVLNTEALLRNNGIEAEVFAMDYPQNLTARYRSMFPAQVDFGGGLGNKLRAMKRTMGTDEVKARFNAVLDEFHPDVVHLHNIHSYLSPVVGELAHRRGIRVVWTLHDYKLLCPRYDCLLDNQPCEKCFTGAKRNVITHRCMKGSLPASAVAWLEALKWNRKVLERNTDVFVCPSEFMAAKMRQGGFNPDKIKVLNNFLDPVKLNRYQNPESTVQRQDYYCFVGRLSQEKGVESLLQVASSLPYQLKIAGGGPLEDTLRKQYANCSNIEFLGMLDAQGVVSVLTGAKLSVVPSQWYENNPLTVVESLCAGTPVAGSQIGGIPELIDDTNGITFQPFDNESLSAAITSAMTRQWNHDGIAHQALARFSPDTHLSTLLTDIYHK